MISHDFAKRVQAAAGTQFSLAGVTAILNAAETLASGWPDCRTGETSRHNSPIPVPQDRREDLPEPWELRGEEG